MKQMSLTKNDLDAIAGMVKKIVDDAIELSDQRTAIGFTEVHGRIDGLSVGLDGVKSELDGVKSELDGVKSELDGAKSELGGVKSELNEVKVRLGTVENTVGRIEMQQRAMVNRLDDHSVRLHRVESTLKLKAA